MSKELKCPKCNSIVNHCIYTANLNGDRSWRCDECSYKFDTDINGNVREYVNDMNEIKNDVADVFLQVFGEELQKYHDQQVIGLLNKLAKHDFRQEIKPVIKQGHHGTKEVVIKTKITSCYHECPYFSLDGGPGPVMMCNHPYFKDKEGYAGAIINHDEDIKNGFPTKCPLFDGVCKF